MDSRPTRRVLSWRLSNTHDARFCTDALTEAVERYTDQGSQFTSLSAAILSYKPGPPHRAASLTLTQPAALPLP